MRKFGIRTDGTEEELEELILETYKKFTSPTFFEIGTAGGATLAPLTQIIVENDKGDDWLVVGTDLPNGYTLSMQEVFKNFNGLPFQTRQSFAPLTRRNAHLILMDARELLNKYWEGEIHFGLIDGAHCKCCSTQDFLKLEPHIAKGGLVLFHDAGKLEYGTDHQHDGHYIEVRDTVTDLGLFNNTRPGWKFIKEIHGSRHWGGEGNSFAVVEKI